MNCWEIFKTITAREEIKRVLLMGPPGTSKTSSAVKSVIAGEPHFNITLHEESTPSELIGHWVPKGQLFEWHHGPGARAWGTESERGSLLVINEIDHAGGPLFSILLALLDDPDIAHLTLPNGDTIRPKNGFRVIATMNGGLGDLPEPLIDRFDVKLNINTPRAEAIESLAPDLREIVKNIYSTSKVAATFREFKAFDKLRGILDTETSLKLVFHERAAEIGRMIKVGTRSDTAPTGVEYTSTGRTAVTASSAVPIDPTKMNAEQAKALLDMLASKGIK